MSDFYDFGCGRGGSMNKWSQLLNCTGYGFDISPHKISVCRENGLDCEIADLTQCVPSLPDGDVRFVVMNHLLEHFPTLAMVRWLIAESGRVARDFVYIAVPWFHSDGPLFELGLKNFCNDWPGAHTLNLTALQIYSALMESRRFKSAMFYGLKPITTDDHPHLYAIEDDTEASTQTGYDYDPARHMPRPSTGALLPFACYEELAVLAFRGDPGNVADKFQRSRDAVCIKTVRFP
jgi:SAM-dependent methyltransferase